MGEVTIYQQKGYGESQQSCRPRRRETRQQLTVFEPAGRVWFLGRIRKYAFPEMPEAPDSSVPATLQSHDMDSFVRIVGEHFPRVLERLRPRGLVVTDGSIADDEGPKGLSKFWSDDRIKGQAQTNVVTFEYRKRKFRCVGYVGEKYGPTLVWLVE